MHTLHVSSTVLLLDGRENASFFETMLSEGAFPRLVKLIRLATDDDKGLHRTLLQLLYEMSRVQRLARDDLGMLRFGSDGITRVDLCGSNRGRCIR